MKNINDPEKWTETVIQTYLQTADENTLSNGTGEKAWTNFIIGFAAGDDDIFRDYKQYVGDFHWTPEEIFNKTFPAEKTQAGELTVISYILPQTEATKKDNRKETNRPSQRWARARIFGEQLNTGLQKHLEQSFAAAGIQAVAPALVSDWKITVSEKYGYASFWSQRHAAYAAGLGTFGLCDGLITPKGKAMRTGSVIVKMQIKPTARQYTEHREYCLFYSKGLCGKCIERCPVGALSEDGHDKTKCYEFLSKVTAPYVKKQFGFDGYGCGLCQTGIPCESEIPVN